MPKVSVVIPSYNHGKFIAQTIESVLNQTFQDFEIIVVNNASTDNTKQVLVPFLGRIVFIDSPINLGLSRGMNVGAKVATGTYILFLDSDDQLLPDMLAKQVAELESNPDVAFVCSSCYEVDAANHVIRTVGGGAGRQKNFADLLSDNFVLKLTTVVRRSCFVEAGGFDESLSSVSDYDLWLRLAKHYKFGYTNAVLAKYRVHATNMSKNYEEAIAEHLRLFQKKEITDDLNLFGQKIKRSWLLYKFAGWYEKRGDWAHANDCYIKATWEYPFIGALFWPSECEKFRFTLPYRLLKPFISMIVFKFSGKLNPPQDNRVGG